MQRKVGKLGEKAFELLCATAGFNAHPPEEDLFGWDYLVECPVEHSSHRKLLDSAPSPLEFRVQVKSSDGARGSEPIALDHMLRLATLQMPVFFCFLAFDGCFEPVRMYLVHFGEELIVRALQRVRQLGATGDRNLNKHSLTVSYDERHAVEAPLHQGLKKQVAEHVSVGMTAYIAWKNSILQSAGYTDTRFTGDVTFDDINGAELVDFFLGIRESVALKSMNIVERRFGIGERIEPKSGGPGVLSITERPTLNGTILIRRDAFSPAITFPARWHFPPPTMNLPDDELKYRLVSSTFEMILWPRADYFRFRHTIDPDTECSLQKLRDHAEAMHLLSNPEAPDCRIEFTLEGKVAFAGNVKISVDASNWAEIAAVAEAALAVSQRAGVAGVVQASLEQLMCEKDTLYAIHGLASGAYTEVKVPDLTCHTIDQRTGFIKTFSLMIGNIKIAGAFAVIGKTVEENGIVSLKSNDIRFIRIFGRPATEEWGATVKNELLQIASDELETEGIRAIAV